MSTGFRCSAASRERLEPLDGTASTVRALLVVEAAGPWGVDAIRDCRMGDEVRLRLLDLERLHRVRPLLIRRHARTAVEGTRVFAAYVHGEQPWVETAVLDDVRDLLDVDVSRLGEGRSPGLAVHEEPVFLVCTHGRHDACCAEQGRPLASAMSAIAPGHTWEVSHIGGDRFAGNVLVLPHGLYYGRLLPEDAPDFVESHLAGRLDLDHLRGRSSYPFPVQAAELYLRRRLGLAGLEPLSLAEHRRDATATLAVFVVGDRVWEVHVHTEPAPPAQLTCRASSELAPPRHRLAGITAR